MNVSVSYTVARHTGHFVGVRAWTVARKDKHIAAGVTQRRNVHGLEHSDISLDDARILRDQHRA